MSERVTQVSVPEVVEQEWKRLVASMPFRLERGEIVGSLRLAFLAGAWIGHANHGAIEQHHRKPQPDKPPAERIRSVSRGLRARMSQESPEYKDRHRGYDDARKAVEAGS